MTAADIVNSLDEPLLINILKNFGEEPFAEAIAGAIVARRVCFFCFFVFFFFFFFFHFVSFNFILQHSYDFLKNSCFR